MGLKALAKLFGACCAVAAFIVYAVVVIEWVTNYTRCGDGQYKTFRILGGDIYCATGEPIDSSATLFFIQIITFAVFVDIPPLIIMGLCALYSREDDPSKRMDAYLGKLDFTNADVRRVFAPYVVKYQKNEV